MNLRQISVSLLLITELITLLALYASGEIRLETLPLVTGVILIQSLLRRVLNKSTLISDSFILFALVGIIATALILIFKFHFIPLEIAPYTLLVSQFFIWGMNPTPRNRGWRLALTFLMLVLTSALTPDLIMSVFILGYLLVCSIALLTLFYESELASRGLLKGDETFPSALIRQALSLSSIVFFMSLILFPILPRVNPNALNRSGRGTLPGYNEQISLSGGSGFTSKSNREIVLKIKIPESVKSIDDLDTAFPYRLLRARVLDSFDGKKWVGAPFGRKSLAGPKSNVSQNTILIERSAISTDALPVPYRYIPHYSDSIRHTENDEWFSFGAYEKSFTYNVEPNISQQTGKRPQLLQLSEATRNLVETIAKKIFKNGKVFDPKFQIAEYFKSEGFTASFDSDSDPSLEHFLSDHKKGHCEQFATASVLILDQIGIPARLVSGFKISHPPSFNTLLIRQEDAHAWVEYFNATTRLWIPFDPTPKGKYSWIESVLLREIRDKIEIFWFQYIIGFSSNTLDQNTISLKPLKSISKTNTTFELSYPIIFFGIFFLLILLFIQRQRNRRQKSADSNLILKSKLRSLERLTPIQKQNSIYLELRFGPLSPKDKKWKDLYSKLVAKIEASKD